jgi:glycosyltransferase involved in cell wall biosynthesis
MTGSDTTRSGPVKPDTVSLIIPCRNEERYIASLLDSLLASTFRKERLEILIVDGMSTDATREIVGRYARENPAVRMLDNPDRTTPVALNIGIKSARGSIIMRMDAHSEYPPNYIADCLALLDSTRAGNAGGRVVTVPNGKGRWAKPIARVTSSWFGVGNSAFRTSERARFVDTVPFGTFPREVFERVGLFDERLTRNQDNEFNERLIAAGYKIAFDPKIRVTYKNQATLAGLCHQAFYTGMWNVYTLWLHPRSFRWRRFVPAAFTVYVAVLLAAPMIPKKPLISLLLPLLVYGALAVVASGGIGIPVIEVPRTVITFFIYHCCYGAGTLIGAVNLLTGHSRLHFGVPLRE